MYAETWLTLERTREAVVNLPSASSWPPVERWRLLLSVFRHDVDTSAATGRDVRAKT